MLKKIAIEVILEVKSDINVPSKHRLTKDEIEFSKPEDYSLVANYCRQTCGGEDVIILSKYCIQTSKVKYS